ncbi:MAG: hypothetical protein DRP18_05080 [Candidatus Aenigmatarchaeota archaeon]|nr:MAG: hypothetical protein DRP18_05080 [Candidatus Aenigmarchaeota archaeon]
MKVFPRDVERRIKKVLHRKEMIGLRGSRQSGKTTLFKKISDELRNQGKHTEFISLDFIHLRKEFKKNPIEFIERYKSGKTYFFFDEIQQIPDAGLLLKIIYDNVKDIKVFFSGSSSLEIKTKILPFLVGRVFLFDLLTFNFGEYINALDEKLYRIYLKKHFSLKNWLEGKGEILEPSFQSEFIQYLKEYLVYGGYPEVIKTRDNKTKRLVLENIYSLYIEKDISSVFNISDSDKFDEFVRVLAFQIAQILSVQSLVSELGINYMKTQEFLSILKHTYIIDLVKPFHKNIITELKKSSKVYFLDLGLRNVTINNFLDFDSRNDRGEIFENFVYLQLKTNFNDYKINYWRTTGKAEIDFILSRGNEVIPVEVKLRKEKLSRGFLSFLNTYRPKKALIITLEKFGMEKIGKTLVHWVPGYYL